jgi:hypothetical protein
MSPRFAALAVFLLPLVARAQAWRADLPGDFEGELVLIVVSLGLMAFHIRACARVSHARAHYACFIWVALSAAAVVWPLARIPLAALAVAFLAYGFWRVT